jgi:SAM-dependent methyltransferase
MDLSAVFSCPDCSAPLELRESSGRRLCAQCGALRAGPDGILDFVADPERARERVFYEEEYRQSRPQAGGRSIAELRLQWEHPAEPTHHAVWRALGDLRGNGGESKELYLLTLDPELLIFSDLAAAGATSVRDAYDLSAYEDTICFAAIDALAMPFQDESIDVVYGHAFVHHLPDREAFLRETARVLRPGGYAVFFDDAYSPLWETAKRTVLHPLFVYSHRKVPRSPEDVVATTAGGFREEQLADEVRRAGGEFWSLRLLLAFQLWHRAALVLLPDRFRRLRRHPLIAGPLIRFDQQLARRPRSRQHLIRLVWGMRKPVARRALG